MTFRKSTLLLLGLGMIAALVACSSSSHKNTTVAIAATSGTPQSATVGTAFAAPLAATVTTGGTPTSGVTVTFTAPGSGASGTFAGGVNTATTNSSGVATSAVFTANTTAGAYTVSASATGATAPASFSLTNNAGAAASLAATSGSSQSAVVSTAFANPLVATVTDSHGNGVSGVSVTFTANAAAGASCTFANGTATQAFTTNASGVASATITANSTVGGPYTVTATSAGLTAVTFTTLSNTATPVVVISATSGGGQSATVSTAFTNPLVATVMTNGTVTAGVVVTFTAPASGASGTFSGATNVATATTGANGQATSPAFTANSTSGPYTVTATAPGAAAPANFSLTNISTTTTLGDGNYTFTLSGLNVVDDSLFFVAGTFTVSGGAITGGEQDYVDDTNYGTQDSINAAGSSITVTAHGNLQIVLSTSDSVVGVGGVETIHAALQPSNPTRALLSEFDASGSATGELRQQDTTAAATTPSMGYAFVVSGFDGGEVSSTGNLFLLNMGGIINVDGAGTISGAGSIFDANDNSSGTTFQAETLQANKGTVSAPDAFGRVVFSITPTDTTDFPQISWVGYIADSSRIYLVETADAYFGTTGGVARSQGANTGTFGTGAVSGSTYGAAMTGFDGAGALQLVGEVTFNSGGTVTGVIDFNDLVSVEPASPDPVSAPSFTVASTGRVTVSGLTDGVATTINLQLYLDGTGNAFAVTMDTTDTLGASLSGQVNNSGLTDANLTGTYAFFATGWDGSETGEFSAVGSITATGTGDTFSGFTDFNFFGTTTTNEAASGTYTLLSPGVLSPASITGLDVDSSFANTDNFNIYVVDTTGQSVFIELDTNQLTIGFNQH